MSEYLDNIEVGDTVYIDGDSGFCTGGDEEVTAIRTKYDEDTGVPFRVICCDDHEFDGRNGGAITSPTAYYIAEE